MCQEVCRRRIWRGPGGTQSRARTLIFPLWDFQYRGCCDENSGISIKSCKIRRSRYGEMPEGERELSEVGSFQCWGRPGSVVWGCKGLPEASKKSLGSRRTQVPREYSNSHRRGSSWGRGVVTGGAETFRDSPSGERRGVRGGGKVQDSKERNNRTRKRGQSDTVELKKEMVPS